MNNIIQFPTKAMNTKPILPTIDYENSITYDEWISTDKGKQAQKDSEYFYKCLNEYFEDNAREYEEAFGINGSTPKAGE